MLFFLNFSTKTHNFALYSLTRHHRMRKIILPIIALVIVSVATTTTFTSCKNETKHTDTLLDTAVIAPKPVEMTADSDSTNVENGKTLITKSVTGKVTDGAMNSVFIEVAPDSTVEFSYPELNRNDNKVFYNWQIDDMITVTYVETTRNGESLDSVVSIQKAQ